MTVKWKRKAAEEKAPKKKAEPKPKKKPKEAAPPPPPAEPSTALAAPLQAPQAAQEAGSTVTARLSKNLSLDLLTRKRVVDVEKERKKLNVLPTYACSSCMIGPECPMFEEGFVCAFLDQFKAFPVRDVDSVLGLMREVVEQNKQRMFFALLNEKIVGGGEASPNVTRLTEVVMNQAKDLVQIQQDADRVSVEIEASGAGETTEKKVGILTKLFGGGGSAPALEEHKPQVIDVSASTTEEEYPQAFVGREQDSRDLKPDADEVLAGMTEVT